MYPDAQSQRSACLLMLLSALLLLGACDATPANTPAPSKDLGQPIADMDLPDQPAPLPDATPDMPPKPKTPKLLASSRPRVNFKGGRRLGNDLSRALDLPRAELCKELSSYDCVEQVHQITLGGVEPYRLGINDPVPVAPVTAPIAVDRIALQACDRRAELDLSADAQSALIFGSLLVNAPEPSKEALGQAVDKLYDRLLQRDATQDERRALIDFWSNTKARSAEPARDWATLSCFMIATSLEALFY